LCNIPPIHIPGNCPAIEPAIVKGPSQEAVSLARTVLFYREGYVDEPAVPGLALILDAFRAAPDNRDAEALLHVEKAERRLREALAELDLVRNARL
jgi:hypothetical protein